MKKYSNSKYKSKYIKYKNKYLQEKYEYGLEDNNNIGTEYANKNIIISETSSISEKRPNLNNTAVKTLNIGEKKNISSVDLDPKNNISSINFNNVIYDTNNGIENGIKPLYNYKTNMLNMSNVEISENSDEENSIGKIITNKTAKKSSKTPSKKSSKTSSKASTKASTKKSSKASSKAPSKKSPKASSKKSSKASSKKTLSNKIYSEKINWNVIRKKEVKKINFTKNKITIKFDKSSLELGYTSTSNETTWFDKFIRVNILDKEPVYLLDDICNVKINNPFIKPLDEYKKFVEYENLVGKKIKYIKWIGDSWMYPSNKQECDHNHIFKIQTLEGEYYLFILRCSSSGGIDSNLTINYKK